jgi:hypothetical protein
MVDFWELGFALFGKQPDMILAAVWWRAGEVSDDVEDQLNFISGYTAARRQHDDYKREHHAGTDPRGDQAENRPDHATVGAGNRE